MDPTPLRVGWVCWDWSDGSWYFNGPCCWESWGQPTNHVCLFSFSYCPDEQLRLIRFPLSPLFFFAFSSPTWRWEDYLPYPFLFFTQSSSSETKALHYHLITHLFIRLNHCLLLDWLIEYLLMRLAHVSSVFVLEEWEVEFSHFPFEVGTVINVNKLIEVFYFFLVCQW